MSLYRCDCGDPECRRCFPKLEKPRRIDRHKAKRSTRRAAEQHERAEKAKVRYRDGYCRFPRCGCKRLHMRLEVSHDVHKGMGGNVAGDRSTADQMMLLCWQRHQHGQVSIHAGTLRAVALTARGFDGPVRWEVDERIVNDNLTFVSQPIWRAVYVESRPCQGVVPDDWAEDTLLQLAQMDL
jgi:hypothetical protein